MTREEAKQRLLDTAWLGSNEDRDKTEEAVRVLITALEQEPKQGHWIDMDDGFSPCECSECKSVEFIKSKYCPNCGARMSEVSE